MATKRLLVERWLTPDGQQRWNAITDAFDRRAPNVAYKDEHELGPVDTSFVPEVRAIVAGIPLEYEVAPQLDLRGIAFTKSLWIRNLDLSNVRFDFADLFDNLISDCVARNTCFDSVTGAHQCMHGDFTGASFRKAKLNRASFYRALLVDADFSNAVINCAKLEKANCRNAKFNGSKLRSAFLPYADLRGADLSGADCSNATLGGIMFDESTIVHGALMKEAAMSDDFRKWAEMRGAVMI